MEFGVRLVLIPQARWECFSSFSNFKVHRILRRIKDIFNVTPLLLAMYFRLARTLSNPGDVSLWGIDTSLRVGSLRRQTFRGPL
jgi:hypothetical protein